jgi:hypothetical protein
MKAIKFPEANKILTIPDDNTTSQLYVYTDGITCVSEWLLSEEDIAVIVRSNPTAHPAVGLFAGNVLPSGL